MSVINLTKSDGARTRIMAMTVAEPSLILTRGSFDAFAADTNLDRMDFADLLSAVAMHARDSVNAYTSLAERTMVDGWRADFRELAKRSANQVTVLEDLIGMLGGKRFYVSPMARITQARNTKLMETVLLSGSVDTVTEELAGLELALILEHKNQENWELAAAICRHLHDSKTKKAMEAQLPAALQDAAERLALVKRTFQDAILSTILQESPA